MRGVLIVGAVVAAALIAGSVEAQQMAQATAGAARAGVAAAVRGEVKLAAVPGVREIGKDVASGDPIFLGDRVTTGGEGRLQIMLADETVFTIGPNAAMTIDTFVYDPATSAGKVTATVLKGTFRFVTGKVAKREPSDMEVKLPVGSIGVRGTSVAGETDGTRATVVLLGPGPETNTGERVGRILVTGTGATGAATTVEIVRPGFGTEITGTNVPPSAAVRIDPGRIAAITAPLAGTAPRAAAPPAPPEQGGQQSQNQGQPAPGQPQPGTPAQQAGPAPQPGAPVPGQAGPAPQPGAPAPLQAGPAPQGQPMAGASAGGGITFARAPVNPTGGLGGIRTIGALAPVGQQAVKIVAAAAQTPPPVGPDTTYEQLRSINSGTATFNSGSIAMAGGGASGSYVMNYTYNFGSQQASGFVTVTANAGGGLTGGTGQVQLIANPFATGSGVVQIVPEGITIPSGALAGNIVKVEYGFKNSGNTVFKTLGHTVTYNQGGTYNAGTRTFTGGTSISGSGTTTRP